MYFLPYAEELVAVLAGQMQLLFAIDGSAVGRGCMALMISVIYKKRSLPLVWLVVAQANGHVDATLHGQQIQEAAASICRSVTYLIPNGSRACSSPRVSLTSGSSIWAWWLIKSSGSLACIALTAVIGASFNSDWPCWTISSTKICLFPSLFCSQVVPIAFSKNVR